MTCPLFLCCLFVFFVSASCVTFKDTPSKYHWGNRSSPIPNQYCEAFYPFCSNGVDKPTFPDTDIIDIYYLEAPVFELKFHNTMKKFDLFHSGVGFISRKTGAQYVIEFDAIYEVANATFPFLLKNKTDIVWCNEGAVCFVEGINVTYWTEQNLHVGSISGQIMNHFLNYVPIINNTYVFYETWDVWHGWNDHLYLQSMTCADFCWVVFQQIFALGGKFNCDLTVKHDYINLYSETDPQLVDFETNKQKILEFYTDFQWKKGESIEKIILDMLKSVFLEKFVYSHGQYYKIDLHFPFIGYEYTTDALPGCTAPP